MLFDREQLQFAKAYYATHGQCDHPWYRMTHGMDDWGIFECIVCKHSKTVYDLCDCKPWYYIPIPKLTISGRCSECGRFRNEEDVI